MISKNCEFLHPKLCAKYCRFGKGKFGCMKAGNCDKFHPKLCNGSVKTKSCYKKDCKLTHLKGTRRVENRNEKPANPGSDFLEKSQRRQKPQNPPGFGPGSEGRRLSQNRIYQKQNQQPQPQQPQKQEQQAQQPQTLLLNQQMIQNLLLLLIQSNPVMNSQMKPPQTMNLSNPHGNPTWADVIRSTI